MTILNKKPRTKLGDCKNSKNQCKSVVWDCRNRRTKIAQRVLLKQIFRKKIKKNLSRAWFRSTDLWVMGPARFHCATLLLLLECS